MDHPDYQTVYNALSRLFSNTAVSQEETLEALETLQGDIETMVTAVKQDLEG